MKPSSSIAARMAFLLFCATDHRNLKDRDQHGRGECRSSTQSLADSRGECWSTCSRGLSTSPDEVSVSTHSTLTIWILSGEHDNEKKLRFRKVAWSAKEAEGLAAALPRFQNLKTLELSENNLTMKLQGALPSRYRHLCLELSFDRFQ